MSSQKIDFQVAHAISGRMRLKIPRVRTDLEFRYRLKMLLEAVEGVTQGRVDADAQSVVVNYDPEPS